MTTQLHATRPDLFYMISRRANARLAHMTVENFDVTACGMLLTGRYYISTTLSDFPDSVRLCLDCVRSAQRLGWIPATQRERQSKTLDRTETAVSKQMVSMFAAGLEDQKIARQLGISGRTLSRYVADSMCAAGATTRFQWGYLLARQHQEGELRVRANR